jgi:hypothetical protein
MQKLTTAIFTSRLCATQAVEDLGRLGCSAQDMQMSDSNCGRAFVVNEFTSAPEGMIIGAAIGSLTGLFVLGFTSGLSAISLLANIAAGQWLVLVTGCGAGLLGGGIIGGLIGLRIPQHKVEFFRNRMVGQAILLGVYTENHLCTKEAGLILRANNATRIRVESVESRENNQR